MRLLALLAAILFFYSRMMGLDVLDREPLFRQHQFLDLEFGAPKLMSSPCSRRLPRR